MLLSRWQSAAQRLADYTCPRLVKQPKVLVVAIATAIVHSCTYALTAQTESNACCCSVDTPAVGKYVDLLNDISTGNYERAVTCDTAKLFFGSIELVSNDNLASLTGSSQSAVKSFISTAVDEEEAVLKLVVSVLLFLEP